MEPNWFYFFVVAGTVIPFWISVGVMELGVIIMDIILLVFWGYMPNEVHGTMALLNVFMLARALLYKPFAPKIQQ